MLILLPLVVGLCLHTLPHRAEAEVSGSTQLDLRNPKSTSTAQSQPASTFHLPSRSSSPSQLLRQFHPANCTVGNTTYAHGQTFKLDCKTQCVCENGRHACSSLCPKEQLPAPEDTISCRSPRLVEVPGHCCKMWLCENPTADVTATCRNSSTSPWTPCSRRCGIGLSTRVTSTTRGCHELSNVRLCENRACDREAGTRARGEPSGFGQQQQQQLNQVDDRHGVEDVESNVLAQDAVDGRRNQAVAEHRIRKGHECRHIQRLGPARIRLGPCVSRKLYRPKLCGRCQRSSKCCVPSVSTTIQVELLCPLQANDPISYVQQGPRHHQQQQQQQQEQWLTEGGKEGEGGEREQHLEEQHLWDTVSLEPIDQEFLQSHQQQIENKFIAVEWILKCECSRNAYCGNSDDDNNNNNNPHAYHNYNNNSNYNNNNINGYTMGNNYNNNGNDKENNKNNKNKIRDKRPQNALSFGAAGRATAAEAEQEEESTNGISVESNYYGISGSGSDNNNNNNINNYHRNHYNDKNNNYNYNYQPNNDNDENNNNNYHFASNEQRKQLQREQQQEHQYKQQLEKQKQHQQHQRKHKQKQHRQQHAYLPRT